jgi:hypothetical protein
MLDRSCQQQETYTSLVTRLSTRETAHGRSWVFALRSIPLTST